MVPQAYRDYVALEVYLTELQSQDIELALESDTEAVDLSSITTKAKSGDGKGAIDSANQAVSAAEAATKKGNHKRAIAICIGILIALLAIMSLYIAKSNNNRAVAVRDKIKATLQSLRKSKKSVDVNTDADNMRIAKQSIQKVKVEIINARGFIVDTYDATVREI